MMGIKKELTYFLTAFVIFAVFATAAFVFDSSKQKPLIPVSLSLSKTPLSAPLYIALEQGYFAQCGLDITVEEVIGGKRSFSKVIERLADIGTSSDSVIGFESFSYDDFKVAVSFASSTNDVKIVYRKDLDLTTTLPVRVGFYPGSASEYLLEIYLALTGHLPNALFVPLPPEQLLNALLAGDIDAMANWEPYPWKAIDAKDNAFLIANSKNMSSLHFDLILNDDFVTNKPDAVTRLIDALALGAAFINEQPIEAKQILISKLQLDPEFIEWIWDDYSYAITSASNLTFSYAANARWFVTEEIVSPQPIADFTKLTLALPKSTTQLSTHDIRSRCDFL